MKQDLQEFYSRQASGDQQAVIDMLRGLGRKEQKLLDIVNAGYRALKEGRGFLAVPIPLPDGGSQLCDSPCTDLDDLRVATRPVVGAIQGIRYQIGQCLKEAVQLGMGEMGFVRDHLGFYTEGYKSDPIIPLPDTK